MRRLLIAVVAVLAAVFLQVTLLDRLPLPGGSPPDLVLLVVVTLALASGPLEGAVIGFGAGLAADIAPPAAHLVGLSALVFCLVGYGCGRLRGPLESSAWLPLAGVVVGVGGGECLYALAGLIFGDPDITWHSMRQVLPPQLLYDLVLSPFVLYTIVRLGRYRGWGGQPASALTGRELAFGGLGLATAGGSVRYLGGSAPRLKAAAFRRPGGLAGQPGGAWVPRPVQLRLRGGVAGSAARGAGGMAAGGPLGTTGPGRPAAPVRLRFGTSRRRGGAVVGAMGTATGGARQGLASTTPRIAFGGRSGQPRARPGRIAQPRGAAFSGGPSAIGQAARARGAKSPRLRAAALRGGPSAIATGGQGRTPKAPRLRLTSRHRGDGLVGGGVLNGRSGRGALGGRGGRGSGGSTAGRFARKAPGRGAFGARPVGFLGRSAFGARLPGFFGRRLGGRGMRGAPSSELGSGAAPRFRGGGRSGPIARFRTYGAGGSAAPRFRGSGGGLLRRLRSRVTGRPGAWRMGNGRTRNGRTGGLS